MFHRSSELDVFFRTPKERDIDLRFGTYSKVRIAKNLSDSFPIQNDLKKVDILPLLLFNFA